MCLLQVLERRRQAAIQSGRMIDLSAGADESGTAEPTAEIQAALRGLEKDEEEEREQARKDKLAPIIERQVCQCFNECTGMHEPAMACCKALVGSTACPL